MLLEKLIYISRLWLINFYSPALIMRGRTADAACSYAQGWYSWRASKAVQGNTFFHFGQNQPDELTPLIKFLVPACLIFHGIKERLLQTACEVSVPPKRTGTNEKQQFDWVEACFVENPCWEEVLACLSRLRASHICSNYCLSAACQLLSFGSPFWFAGFWCGPLPHAVILAVSGL